MKKIVLSLVFSLTSFLTIACSCTPFYSFCEYKTIYNPDLILSAEIIDTNQFGIRLKKIDIIEGTELRDTIPVWNDTDFVCTGTVSMRASQIGQVGDTVIVMLPRIDSVYTTWGVLGDYRTPIHLCGRAFIKVENDTLTHSPNVYLQGNQPPYLFVEKPSYQDFITYLSQYGDCDDLRKGDFTYKPFPESAGTYWIDEESAWGFGREKIKQNRITKDTMIGGVNYQKIVQTIEETFYNPNPIITYTTSLLGYMRNDSANRRVWLRLTNQSADTLLYDFNLSLDSSIHESFLVDTAQANFLVDSVRFQRYADGVLRKQYYLQGGSACGPYIFIEGIGLSSGAFQNSLYCLLTSNLQLICLNENNQTVYPDSSTACNLITAIEELNQKTADQFRIYPNPVEDIFTIEPKLNIEKIHLFSIKGEMVQQLNSNRQNWKLDAASGIYFLQIETKEGEVFRKKIVHH